MEVKKHEFAEVDYMQGMKYKDIAEKYGVSVNTVKSWKKRHAWNRKRGAPKPNKGCTQNRKSADINEEPVTEEVNQTIENTALNDKQRLFCLLYIRSFNATKAYQRAYECSYTTAMVNGCKLLRNPKIKAEIMTLKEERLNREFLTEADIFQKYMDIAFADINDYVDFGKKEVTFFDKHGNEHKGDISYVDLKESSEVDGTIISEISQGRNGIKVKLSDRLKAMQWLSDHMDLATEKQRAEIEALKAKAKADSDEGTENEDDGFIDALNASAREDWLDEENS